MPLQPSANDTLEIDGLRYLVAEHPAAPDVGYRQEGRAAILRALNLHPPELAKSVTDRFYRTGLCELDSR